MQALTATVDPSQKDQAWLHQSPADIPQRREPKPFGYDQIGKLLRIQSAARKSDNWRVLKPS